MVMQEATADACPQCGADIRGAGQRCPACGFWLPARPALRTRPPQSRPAKPKDESRRTTLLVLGAGGVVVLALLAIGAAVWMRRSAADNAVPQAVASASAPAASTAPHRLEPSAVLAEARRRASAWHRDAVLVSLTAHPLDAHGVAPGGEVELVYAKPRAQSLSGGGETSAERLTVRSSAEGLSQSEEHGGKGRIAPEPNCLFEDAWAAAQRAGADVNAGLALRYAWSDKQARPIWEVLGSDGNVLRRLDGVSCSILTR